MVAPRERSRPNYLKCGRKCYALHGTVLENAVIISLLLIAKILHALVKNDVRQAVAIKEHSRVNCVQSDRRIKACYGSIFKCRLAD